MKYNIILRNGRYALLEMETQYVVACGFDETLPENQQWSQGYYYTHWNDSEIIKQRMLSATLDCYRILTETNYIPRCRLEELATKFKDGLLETDKDFAMEYFDSECEMEDYEKEFFGIESETESEDGEFDDSHAWEDDSNRGYKDCPDSECTGHCMSCYYRPV